MGNRLPAPVLAERADAPKTAPTFTTTPKSWNLLKKGTRLGVPYATRASESKGEAKLVDTHPAVVAKGR
jgi:hypothetical protein